MLGEKKRDLLPRRNTTQSDYLEVCRWKNNVASSWNESLGRQSFGKENSKKESYENERCGNKTYERGNIVRGREDITKNSARLWPSVNVSSGRGKENVK